MGGRRCEGYVVCSDAAQQHFAKGKMLGGRSAVKKVREDFFDKLKKAAAMPQPFYYVWNFQPISFPQIPIPAG